MMDVFSMIAGCGLSGVVIAIIIWFSLLIFQVAGFYCYDQLGWLYKITAVVGVLSLWITAIGFALMLVFR